MRKGTCRFFSGFRNDKCHAGHKYLDVAIPPTEADAHWRDEYYPGLPLISIGITNRIPCHSENGVNTCQDYNEPTQEELDIEELDFAKIIRWVTLTRVKIMDDIKLAGKKKRDWQGKIPCPICEVGVVIYSYAGSYNGHIHAKCSTPDCVQWIE